MSAASGQARNLRAALAQAPDFAVGRVVAMLDGLMDRGEADALLEGVRPRLRRLRPARPLRLARVLLLPLEGALVPPAAWRGNAAELPRTAITPLVAAVTAALGPLAEEVEVACLSRSSAEAPLIGVLGAKLWPAAGAATLPCPPPGWTEAGLTSAVAKPVLALCGALWRAGPALWTAREAASQGPPDHLLRAALAPLAAEGQAALTAGMVLLLREATRPGAVVAIANALCPAVGTVATREVEALLTRDAAALAATGDPAEAAIAAATLGAHLTELESALPPSIQAARRASAATVRHDAAREAAACFAAALASRLLRPVATACLGPPASDATMTALEEVAHGLRELEAAGRKLGCEAAFDAARREGVTRLLAHGAEPRGLTRVEISRLVEILAGPEAALPLLGESA